MADVPMYHSKLVGIKKEMVAIIEKSNKMMKRVEKLRGTVWALWRCVFILENSRTLLYPPSSPYVLPLGSPTLPSSPTVPFYFYLDQEA